MICHEERTADLTRPPSYLKLLWQIVLEVDKPLEGVHRDPGWTLQKAHVLVAMWLK